MIGSTLTDEGRNKLCNLLQRNLDIFACKPTDMTGVPRHITEHCLNMREGCSPVRQKKRGQAADRNQAIQEEVRKLMEAGIMKEVHYHDWLSNPVMVKKHDANAYKGYHQIQMAKEDEEKTAFITSQGIFCYTKMPFGLRNAGETYQLLVDKAFHKQIGRNLKVYVDDLVIKSRSEDKIVRDIEETFKILREINMKLNPKKYKVDAVLSLSSPKCLKDVQKLNGKLASLNRFLAKSAEKSLPFFKTLKKCTKKSDFHWTAEAKEAFKQMKQLIAELPMLIAPMEKEELIVYLAAAKETVSAVLMTEREAKQMPIYFVSRALRGPKLNYTSMEKLVLALVHASKRLKRYFQAHPIIVITNQPIQQVLSRLEVVLLYRLSEARLILTNPEWMEFTYALTFGFDATNNEAEYEALIAGLRIAEQMGVKNLQANVDSRLVANQVNETYVAKETDMIRCLEKVITLTNSFKAFSIRQVPRSENKKVVALRKIASTSFAHLTKQVLVKELKEKSISKVEILAVVEEEGDTWMTLIFKYLAEGILLEDVKKARAIRRPLQTNYVLREIHEGSCSMHTNGLVERANHSLGEGIKARLDARSKNWMEELPHVLWVYRTMIKSNNRDTPFLLTYGTEAVILAEIGMPTLRTTEVDLGQNNEALEINLDLLEERRGEATIREAKSKAKMEKYYNSKVQNTSFKPGDLVYRNNDASRAEDTGKLGPKWEGPYDVTKALGKGAYKLIDRDGKQLLIIETPIRVR
ncbi:reverse transcriptase domain-containing protein [Tanacetum coccineum]